MNYINQYDRVVPTGVCKEILELYLTSLHKHSEKTDYNLQQTVLEAPASKSSDMMSIINSKVLPLTNKAIDDSIPSNLLDHRMYRMMGAGLMHHKEGTTIPYHYDAPYQGDKVSDIGCLLYLNEDYEGGELLFPLQKKTIKPKVGDIVIFPTNCFFPHLTTMNQGADRYVLRLNYYYPRGSS
jgi:hypothetical protein